MPSGRPCARRAACFSRPGSRSGRPTILSRSAFRRRLKRYAEDQRSDLAYAFLIFRADTNVLVGGLTLANIRRGVAQAGSIGYWIGAAFCASRLHDRGGARVDPVLFRHVAAAPPRGRLHSRQPASVRLLEKTGFTREGYARRISLHQRRVAGSFALWAAENRLTGGRLALGPPRLACYKRHA